MQGFTPANAAGAPGQQTEIQKLFLNERDMLNLTGHQWELEGVEGRLLERYRGWDADKVKAR